MHAGVMTDPDGEALPTRPRTAPAGTGAGTALQVDLAAALRGGAADVDFSPTARALKTMDASNYRRVPLGVVAPRDADDVAAALAVCREHGVPVSRAAAGPRSPGRRPAPAWSWTSPAT